jgi:hypothetical protein
MSNRLALNIDYTANTLAPSITPTAARKGSRRVHDLLVMPFTASPDFCHAMTPRMFVGAKASKCVYEPRSPLLDLCYPRS